MPKYGHLPGSMPAPLKTAIGGLLGAWCDLCRIAAPEVHELAGDGRKGPSPQGQHGRVPDGRCLEQRRWRPILVKVRSRPLGGNKISYIVLRIDSDRKEIGGRVRVPSCRNRALVVPGGLLVLAFLPIRGDLADVEALLVRLALADLGRR